MKSQIVLDMRITMRVLFFLLLFGLSYKFTLSAQTRRALLIGISNYDTQKTDWPKIHGTNDVALMNKALVGFKVTKLLEAQATYDRIINAIKKLTTETNRGDIIYIHFSGHGQPVEDLDKDEKDGWDESFIPYDASMTYTKGVYEGQYHLTDDKLHVLVDNLRKKIGPQGMLYVSIDACHAGESYRGEKKGKILEAIPESDEFIASLDYSKEENEDNEDFERGSSVGFSKTDRKYDVDINTAKSFGNISPKQGCSPVIMMESSLSVQPSKELKLKCIGQDGKTHNFYCGLLAYSIYKVLRGLKIKLTTTNTQWVDDVRLAFNKTRPTNINQNLVIERTK